MGRIPILLFAMTALSGCKGQTFIELTPNLILPNPPPSAPIAQWIAAPGRTPISMEHDGVTLRGFRYLGAATEPAAVLFFNGNGMTAIAADPLYRSIAALGPSVFIYDYRGYGFSTGTPDLFAYRADALQQYDALVAATPGHRVFVYGFSMGTAMATYIASKREVTGLILAAPIASAEDEFPIYAALIGYPASSIANSHPSPEAKDIFGETAMIAKSHAPLLVLHGLDDVIVPIPQGREVFSSSPSKQRRMVELPGTGHNQTASQPASLQAVQKFFTEVR
jgi:pimeloyl-ACP methyl ester carboxylesterase